MRRHIINATLVVTLLIPMGAFASHYYLEDIEFIESSVMEEFTRFGMQTTEDVLTRVQTPDARSTLSYSTGIPEARLLEIARICEFLQIRGVGPKVAHLLVATGVANVSDLATRDPLILLDELQQVNAVEVHTNVQPELRHVQEWIEGAQSATQLVTY